MHVVILFMIVQISETSQGDYRLARIWGDNLPELLEFCILPTKYWTESHVSDKKQKKNTKIFGSLRSLNCIICTWLCHRHDDGITINKAIHNYHLWSCELRQGPTFSNKNMLFTNKKYWAYRLIMICFDLLWCFWRKNAKISARSLRSLVIFRVTGGGGTSPSHTLPSVATLPRKDCASLLKQIYILANFPTVPLTFKNVPPALC